MYLIFDTETTGLPRNYKAPITDSANWPRAVQIAWQLHDQWGNLIEHQDFLIAPDGFDIPYDAEKVHGISTKLAETQGVPIAEVFAAFNQALSKTQYVVGQNIGFDINIMGAEFYRYGVESPLTTIPVLDTCTETTANLCQIAGGKGGRYKLPTLTELHSFLFGIPFSEAHNATADVEATARCFFELIRRGDGCAAGTFTPEYLREFQSHHKAPIQPIGLQHVNLKDASEALRSKGDSPEITASEEEIALLQTAAFAHLHNHTQYSILQSTTAISDLVKITAQEKMPAVALTDSGNMMAAFHFVQEVQKHNKEAESKNKEAEEKGETPTETIVKPIIGCEFNICENHLDRSHQDNGYQVVILAKNKEGYQNLIKMASIASTKGFYYVPRIDKAIVAEYKNDLIVLSGGINGEIPSKILNIGTKQAEEALLWWKDLFGEDFYLEVMRHGQQEEDHINSVLVEFSKKHQVKLVATNNTFYIHKKDASAHDILLCVKDGEKQKTPIGRGRGYRFGMPNDEYYFKTSAEMKALFKDIPQAILNIQEIIDKVTPYGLARDILLPKFDIPEPFQVADDPTGKKGENNYLRHLTYEGAKRKYPEITDEIRERLDFELSIIEKTGYPGYFLIVQDFIAAARKMGVSVGPGRGSAAGSAVAYCLDITNMDPIKYDLLFERFLNPDRVSMPDIDIDFEDSGRQDVINYVIGKYGESQVARIITYGKMAAKSAIKDTARVLDVPLQESNRLAALVPSKPPGLSLKKLFKWNDKELREKVRSEELPKVDELKQLLAGEGDVESNQTIQQANIIEGSVRNTGIHACGVIITPDDITNFVPVALAKDSDLFVTQFDNSVVESAGLLKMDFLGLSTLTLIKDTIENIKQRHGIELDAEAFPLDDKKTYELFQRGETVGIFQYESTGMQKYMRELKPTVFADLIAMNALYRPGPLEYIPSFIRRKHGIEPIEYDLPDMKEYLEETYGITVYQEQVMLLSQKLAGFTKGEADMLRKAMGKKQIAVLEKMKPKFITQASERGHDSKKLDKIWADWEKFAAYAFNKSHSTCYAWVGYQTAYLKANYPAEYMAAVLSNNMGDIKTITFFLEECHRMGVKVLPPDVNESLYKFAVNKNGDIRFGMGAVKGVGKAAVDTIVENRQERPYSSIFDLAKRVDYKNINKKAFESIALAGGFDSFANSHRAQYFYAEADGIPFIEKAIRFGNKYQESKNSAQMSLFGGIDEAEIPEPTLPKCESWGNIEQLRREKEVVGIYISGHPLDDFKHTICYFCNIGLAQLQSLTPFIGREISVAGMVTEVQHRTSKNGKGFGFFTLEDYDGSYEFRIFDKDYLEYQRYMVPSAFLYIKFRVVEGYINKETQQRGEPRMQFVQVMQLPDVLSQLSKKITLHLNIQDITPDLVQNYKKLIDKHKGNQSIYFMVHSNTENIHLNMENAALKVAITKDFLGDLDNFMVTYNLNDLRLEPKTTTEVKEDSQDEDEESIEEMTLLDD